MSLRLKIKWFAAVLATRMYFRREALVRIFRHVPANEAQLITVITGSCLLRKGCPLDADEKTLNAGTKIASDQMGNGCRYQGQLGSL